MANVTTTTPMYTSNVVPASAPSSQQYQQSYHPQQPSYGAPPQQSYNSYGASNNTYSPGGFNLGGNGNPYANGARSTSREADNEEYKQQQQQYGGSSSPPITAPPLAYGGAGQGLKF